VNGKKRPGLLKRDEGGRMLTTIKEVKIQPPPADCLSPIGETLIKKGLKKELRAEFIVTAMREPKAHSGSPFLVEAGVVSMIETPLKEQGIAVEVYAGVKTEPTDIYVHEGTEMLKQVGADLVIGLGGGSAMDCAKCIAVMAENPGRLPDYEGAEANFHNNKTVPVITLPTT